MPTLRSKLGGSFRSTFAQTLSVEPPCRIVSCPRNVYDQIIETRYQRQRCLSAGFVPGWVCVIVHFLGGDYASERTRW